MRLDKYLADMGCGSRSELKKQIRHGQAAVDGTVIRDPGFAVHPDSCVLFCGEPVAYEEFAYYMLHKPAGVVTATVDARQKTVMDLLPGTVRKGLFPVGRLDRDTEGLLLLCNDGALAHRLLSPGHHVEKVYLARVRGTLADDAVERFREGLRVDEELTALPAGLRILRKLDGPVEETEAEVTIHEGKYHQVRRMFRAVGGEVTALKRLRMGPLVLDPSLPAGKARRLTAEEIEALRAL